MPGLPTRVSTTIDLEAPGRQFGYLDIPSSRNESAWGLIRTPIFVISNGEGPTVLFTGGSHGDEYEGPIALSNLARELQPASIAGRVIVLPMLNWPAVQAGARVSPIDGRNMNRVFPGDASGTVAENLADYITRFILPSCSAVVDLHSGGKTMQFEPFACIHNVPDQAMLKRSILALHAFGAPNSLILEEIDSKGMLDTTVEDMGILFLAAEIGGGGASTARSVAIADNGIRNVLAHFGIIPARPGPENSELLDTSARGSYLHANHSGLFELLVDLGSPVSAGQPIARIHSIARPDESPTSYTAGRDGILIGRHHPGLIRQGDFLALIAGPRDD